MPALISITLKTQKNRKEDLEGDFLRVPRDSAMMVTDHGIEGDLKAGHTRSRQVNLLTSDWLAKMTAAGYRTAPGEFGEQLIVDGLALAEIQPGDHIRIGDEAVLEITKPRTGCSRLEAAQGRSVDPALKAAIGYMARVVQGGLIRVSDPVVRQPADEVVSAH